MVQFKIGDKVKHRFRSNKYQRCVITKIGEGCNGLITVTCEDGFYGGVEDSDFPTQDLTKA